MKSVLDTIDHSTLKRLFVADKVSSPESKEYRNDRRRIMDEGTVVKFSTLDGNPIFRLNNMHIKVCDDCMCFFKNLDDDFIPDKSNSPIIRHQP